MFKFLFIKKHQSKVISYIDKMLEEEPKPSEDLADSDLMDATDESDKPHFSREISTEEPRPRFSREIGAKVSRPHFSRELDPYSILQTMRAEAIASKPGADATFTETFKWHIKRKDLDGADIYKAANMDRRLYSKIICNDEYQPSKDTAISLALALELSLEETNDLLNRAGYILSHSIRRDIIVEYFIKEKVYSLNRINTLLYEMNEKIIGRSV